MADLQKLRDEVEQIHRSINSIPSGVVNKLRVAEPTLITVMECTDRMVDILNGILDDAGAPETSLKPYVPQPEITGGKKRDLRVEAYPPPRHYKTLEVQDREAAEHADDATEEQKDAGRKAIASTLERRRDADGR